MKIFEGKSPNERNKIIAAIVLGVLAVGSLAFAFGPDLVGSSATTVTVKTSPTPKAMTVNANTDTFTMPSENEQTFAYTTVPVVYDPSRHTAPDPGRNIFAFYEPPLPTPPIPTPFPTPPPPTPTPTPPYIVEFVNPQSIYAGSRGFRMEVSGRMFTPDASVYFNQVELPTGFVSDQRLIADVPANLISSSGPRQVIVQSSDGTKYSLPATLNVQAPPKPQLVYVGAFLKVRGNNDTAVFREDGPNKPEFSARLNDVVGGRFRVVSISAQETVLEDTSLGFRHKLALYRPPPGTPASGAPPPNTGRGFPRTENYVPFNPGIQPVPGIPDNIPRVVTPANTNQVPRQRPPRPQRDDDDDDDDDGRP